MILARDVNSVFYANEIKKATQVTIWRHCVKTNPNPWIRLLVTRYLQHTEEKDKRTSCCFKIDDEMEKEHCLYS